MPFFNTKKKICSDLNYCGTHTPCLYGGTCHHLGGEKFNCSCPEGLSGTRCEVIEDPCATMPCQNGATCTVKDPSALRNNNNNNNSSSTATKRPRYYRGGSSMGAPVSVRTIDTKNTLAIGTQQHNETNYVCKCASGFTGAQCDQSEYHKTRHKKSFILCNTT